MPRRRGPSQRRSAAHPRGGPLGSRPIGSGERPRRRRAAGIGGFGMSRERILDAAIERIASDGIDAVRIARIAMDAGVSTALVHYHFATREALLAEALEHSFERAGDVRTADTGQRLRDMVEQCLPLPGDQEKDW